LDPCNQTGPRASSGRRAAARCPNLPKAHGAAQLVMDRGAEIPYKEAKTCNLFSHTAIAEHDRMRKETGKTPMRIAGRAKLEPATGGSRHSSLYRPSYRSFQRGGKVVCSNNDESRTKKEQQWIGGPGGDSSGGSKQRRY